MPLSSSSWDDLPEDRSARVCEALHSAVDDYMGRSRNTSYTSVADTHRCFARAFLAAIDVLRAVPPGLDPSWRNADRVAREQVLLTLYDLADEAFPQMERAAARQFNALHQFYWTFRRDLELAIKTLRETT